jgi:hypothetical protein
VARARSRIALRALSLNRRGRSFLPSRALARSRFYRITYAALLGVHSRMAYDSGTSFSPSDDDDLSDVDEYPDDATQATDQDTDDLDADELVVWGRG